jgi:PTS system nitrogen regulatory IIA component
MELADILAARSVLVCTDALTKRQLFELLAKTAATATGFDQDVLAEALLDRESLGSTALGNGIAIPHGKVPGLPQVVAVFARLESPLDFDAVDDQPVDLVVALLAPLGSGADHLKALSRVARLLRTDSVVDAVRRLSIPARIHEVLTTPVEASNAA